MRFGFGYFVFFTGRTNWSKLLAATEWDITNFCVISTFLMLQHDLRLSRSPLLHNKYALSRENDKASTKQWIHHRIVSVDHMRIDQICPRNFSPPSTELLSQISKATYISMDDEDNKTLQSLSRVHLPQFLTFGVPLNWCWRVHCTHYFGWFIFLNRSEENDGRETNRRWSTTKFHPLW